MKPLKRSTSSPTSIRSDDQDQSEAGSFDEQGRRSDIKETISILETRGKKLCSDLQSLQMGRAELTREVELLSESLEKKRGGSPRGSPGTSVACHRLYRREVPECSPYEDYEQRYEHPSTEGKFKFDWSEVLNWPNLHTLGIVSTGLENEIFGNCERPRCRSCALGRTCHKDAKFSRCSKLTRARNLSLPKTRSCRWCKVDRCKGDVDFPSEVEELSRFNKEYDCECAICATGSPNTESSSSRSYDLEADSSSEFPVFQNASKVTQDCNTSLEIDELCRDRSLETLKQPKPQSRDPKKLSKHCSRPLARPLAKKCSKYSECNKDRENVGELRATVEILQQKCRTKDDVIAALLDEFKRKISADQIHRSLTDFDSKRQVHRFDRSTTASLSNRELKSDYRGRNRKRDIFVGLLLLLLIVFPVWFRLYKHISLEVASVLGYLGYWARQVLRLQMSFPSDELLSR